MNLSIRLPDFWTEEQVDFLLDVVEQLHEAIWDQYGDKLCVYWQDHPPNSGSFSREEEEGPDPDE